MRYFLAVTLASFLVSLNAMPVREGNQVQTRNHGAYNRDVFDYRENDTFDVDQGDLDEDYDFDGQGRPENEPDEIHQQSSEDNDESDGDSDYHAFPQQEQPEEPFDPHKHVDAIQSSEPGTEITHFIKAAEKAPDVAAMESFVNAVTDRGLLFTDDAADQALYATPKGNVALYLIDRFELQSEELKFRALHNARSRQQSEKIRALVPSMDTTTHTFQQLMVDFIVADKIKSVKALIRSGARLNQEAFASVMDAIATEQKYNEIVEFLIESHPQFVL